MADHVQNRLRISGDADAIQRMLEAVKCDEFGLWTLDLNKIVPMPESLNIERSSRTDSGLKAYRQFVEMYLPGSAPAVDSPEREAAYLNSHSDISPEEWALGKAAWDNIRKYQAPTWYEWRRIHWGTKSGAYGYDSGIDFSKLDELWFQTAWEAPHPVIEKLAALYPELTFEHEWADGDLGSNCGRRIYGAGRCLDTYYPEGKAAMDFAFAVWDYDPLEMSYVENSTRTDYICIDDNAYEAVEVLGHCGLFSPDRLTPQDIPIGMFCYDLQNGSDGKAQFLTPYAKSGFAGTIVTREPVDFAGQERIRLSGDLAPVHTGQYETFGEYMEHVPEYGGEVMMKL